MRLTRKQQRRAAKVPVNLDGPLTAIENQPAIVHCDDCEMGEGRLHHLWRSVQGVPIRVRCATCCARDPRPPPPAERI